MKYLHAYDLLGLSTGQLRDYHAQLDYHRTHRLPWEGHRRSMEFWRAVVSYEQELRRRGDQLALFDAQARR